MVITKNNVHVYYYMQFRINMIDLIEQYSNIDFNFFVHVLWDKLFHHSESHFS